MGASQKRSALGTLVESWGGSTGLRRFRDLGFRELFMNRLSLKTIRETRVYLPPRAPKRGGGCGVGNLRIDGKLKSEVFRSVLLIVGKMGRYYIGTV